MSIVAFLPELFFSAAALLFVTLAIVPWASMRRLFFTALVLAALGVIVSLLAVPQQGLLFVDTYRVDLFSQVFKVLIAMGLFLVVCLCGRLSGIDRHWHAEFYLLLFTCTLAMMLLVSAVHLISLYVALELSSYSLYVLTALRRERSLGLEASLKYFLIGGVSSAVMLFGMALLYALTGSAYLADLSIRLAPMLAQPLVIFALALSLGGFFFKLALFPFHFWTPDVYQGAAHQLAAYIAAVSKVAAVAVLLRLTIGTAQGSRLLADLMVGLAIVSMTVGNLAAIAQRDFKRMLAFSSIAHAGYILIGVLSLSPAGVTGSIFYALSLLVMKFTCFMVVAWVAYDGRNLAIEQLAGLHQRAPLLAMALMLAVFGLAGIPPTIGFTAKLLVFTAAIQQGYLVLVLIAMANVVVSLYYYLSVVKAAYLMAPRQQGVVALVLTPSERALAYFMLAALIGAGFFPHYLIEWARAASRHLF
jgi:NADH-quinone oxidoreductase subunit N